MTGDDGWLFAVVFVNIQYIYGDIFFSEYPVNAAAFYDDDYFVVW